MTVKWSIYSRFAYTNEEGEGTEVCFGSDANEIFATGRSATQSPREYMFETDIAKFHLIDTPGIGDCRGTDKDKEHFEEIMAFLSIYDPRRGGAPQAKQCQVDCGLQVLCFGAA